MRDFDSDAVVVFGGCVVAVGDPVDEFLTEKRVQNAVFERGDDTLLLQKVECFGSIAEVDCVLKVVFVASVDKGLNSKYCEGGGLAWQPTIGGRGPTNTVLVEGRVDLERGEISFACRVGEVEWT